MPAPPTCWETFTGCRSDNVLSSKLRPWPTRSGPRRNHHTFRRWSLTTHRAGICDRLTCISCRLHVSGRSSAFVLSRPLLPKSETDYRWTLEYPRHSYRFDKKNQNILLRTSLWLTSELSAPPIHFYDRLDLISDYVRVINLCNNNNNNRYVINIEVKM